MQLEEYIINDVKPLKLDTQIGEVKSMFNFLTYSHLPVLEDGKYVGCVSENDAHCLNKEQLISEVRYCLETFYVRPETHWLDVLEAFARHHTSIMPVVDRQGGYKGYYELKDVMELFNDAPFLYESGNVIVVEKGSTDYSFSEICQIVESNDIKVLGCFISGIRDHFTEVTVKVSGENLNEVLQTFRRYSYEIVNASEHDSFLDTLKERSKYLDKYLNI